MKKITRFAYCLILMAPLMACQQPTSSAPTETTSASSAAPAAAGPAATGPLMVEPMAMSACEPGAEATVTWDVHQSNPEVAAVEVWVAEGAGESKLFAEGGASGEAATGPWTRPGSVFLLKAKGDTGPELARVVIQGPACG